MARYADAQVRGIPMSASSPLPARTYGPKPGGATPPQGPGQGGPVPIRHHLSHLAQSLKQEEQAEESRIQASMLANAMNRATAIVTALLVRPGLSGDIPTASAWLTQKVQDVSHKALEALREKTQAGSLPPGVKARVESACTQVCAAIWKKGGNLEDPQAIAQLLVSAAATAGHSPTFSEVSDVYLPLAAEAVSLLPFWQKVTASPSEKLVRVLTGGKAIHELITDSLRLLEANIERFTGEALQRENAQVTAADVALLSRPIMRLFSQALESSLEDILKGLAQPESRSALLAEHRQTGKGILLPRAQRLFLQAISPVMQAVEQLKAKAQLKPNVQPQSPPAPEPSP